MRSRILKSMLLIAASVTMSAIASGDAVSAARRQSAVVERLRAERDAIDARRAIFGEPPALDRSGIRLQCDFEVDRERQQPTRGLEETRHGAW